MNLPAYLREFRQNVSAQLIGAGAVLILFITLIVIPLNARSKSMDGKIEKARKDLKEITALADEYIKLSAGMPDEPPIKSAGGSMSGRMEKLARELAIENNIKRMTPKLDAAKKRQEELALTITDIHLATLVDLLEKLYQSPNAINVRRARLKSGFEKPDKLEVELTLTPAFL